MINLFDGVQHLHNVKNPMITISFSSQLLSKCSINKVRSSSESGKIFPLMKEICEGKPENSFPVLREVYKEERKNYHEKSRRRRLCV